MSTLALEMQEIARDAAEPVRPGDAIKAQMRRAWEKLARPAQWRLRAAWYGEADCWSGRAVEDFRQRDAARRRREEEARAKAGALADVYAGAAARLAAIDPDGSRQRVAELERAARALGASDRSLASAGGE